ncbi:MAG: endonuclease, partial [Odoribacter sp.]|nr:endonuclease [Odoribacter sp.]
YMMKLQKLAEAVDSVGGNGLPLVVGLAEVENRKVLEDLTGKTALSEGHYGIVHQDSPDARGIDVALLYRQDEAEVLESAFLRIPFPEDSSVRTRDILYAKLLFRRQDTLHFFVCHFPSMIGGEKQSEWKRERAATVVRHRVDSLFFRNPEAGIIVMGDLNGKADTPAQRVLGTKAPGRKIESATLYNTGYYLLKKNYGSYRYQGKWQTIDHIIVSGALLSGKWAWRADDRMTVYSAPFLLEEDKTHFGQRPCPTYRGPRYVGGTSDHLPVFIRLRW